MDAGARERLARTWLRYQRVEGQQRFWAVATLMALVDDDPEESWQVILELVRLADSEDLLGDVGAGPLEDLIQWHGPAFIDRIEAAARSDPKFLTALAGVWAWKADVRPRIDALLASTGQPRL